VKQQRIRRLSDLAALRDQLASAGEVERAAQRQRAADERRAQQAATEFARAVGGTTALAQTGQRRAAGAAAAPRLAAPGRGSALVAKPRVAPAQRERPAAAGSVETGEPTSYRRPGVGPDVLRKLRRGHWPIDGKFDLHGLHLETAYRATGEFLDRACARGLRCVLLIHGKGLGSADGAPVLKGRMRAWLTHQDAVAAYCEAPPGLGGSGALLILLRAAPGTRPL